MEGVSIPQAVSAVATIKMERMLVHISRFNTASGKRCCNKYNLVNPTNSRLSCFNTASGKRCCNVSKLDAQYQATLYKKGFNTASGKRCCNTIDDAQAHAKKYSFNTASGKRCCNSRVWKANIYAVPKASFGKPQTVNGKFSPH